MIQCIAPTLGDAEGHLLGASWQPAIDDRTPVHKKLLIGMKTSHFSEAFHQKLKLFKEKIYADW